ncbi:MAG TPA: alpha/beta fold hydrolase [Burkholderiales bacterium]|jgi:pimeloyl-ACP methyl ester carboxylesterase|nr:alpha/beta fold hydrolase [Burkholderiales bacterium]
MTTRDSAGAPPKHDADLVTTDRFVTHISTVPATRGQTVGLFVREKAAAARPSSNKPHVVLMVHGGFAPSTVAYDLQYRDYSFMAAMAHKGFDVFAMSHTGYGPSPRPLMDDPCNVDAEFQPELIPHVLEERAAPRYPYKLVSSRSEWDELETVIDYVMKLRNVDKVSLVGWSTGAPRAGGYAAMHPDKVDKIVLFGPAPFFASDEPSAQMPEPGAPAILQTKEFLLHRRWQDHVRCEGQLEDPEVPNAMWRELMQLDDVGARWGAHGEGIMRAPNRMNFGWRENLANIKAPTLVLLGEFDNYAKRLEAWHGLGAPQKLFIKVACASHFMQFERGRHLLYRATESWLRTGKVDHADRGEFAADAAGKLVPSAA